MNFQPLRPENQTYHTTNQNLDNRLQQTPYYKPLPLTRRSRFVQLTQPAENAPWLAPMQPRPPLISNDA